jgi:dihydropteroate synthase
MTKLTDFKQNKFIKVKGKLIDLSRAKIMGIINVTPDSFYYKSKFQIMDELLNQAHEMIDQGAEILDIGGVSTRPGALEITSDEELKRVLNPLRLIRKEFPNSLISLDTYRSKIAQIGLNEGVDIINDISGGIIDEHFFSIISKNKCPYVLTHGNGMAHKMFSTNNNESFIQNLIRYFSQKINELRQMGVNDIIIDPGFGFGKTIEQNYEVIQNFELLKILQKPILVGLSRKSMIFNKLKITTEDSLNGTSALNSILFEKGATIFRVHDVKEMSQIRTLLAF